jgi:hypothetical protein
LEAESCGARHGPARKGRSEMATQAIQRSENLTVIEPTIHGEGGGPGSGGWQ